MKSRLAAATLALTFAASAVATETPRVARPPQYIVMSFDGSQSIERWRTTRQFARDNNIKFTYFISGVYYLSNETKNLYQGPGRRAGRSDIGFGSDNADIQTRVAETLAAQQEGNEIGSHANGHFAGEGWSFDQWLSEFTQFTRFLSDVFSLNNLADTSQQSQWAQALSQSIKGFRAPLLSYNVDMYKVMEQTGMVYDTSQIWRPSLWPKKRDDANIWIMPLQQIPIIGTSRRTITMDYNFYVSQSGAQRDLENAALYQTQMYNSYIAHFQNNYNGNRTPIVIGHHFSNWNGGAYWRALMDFARLACRQPEVRCVTHKELANYLEANVGNLPSYQAGNFDKLPAINLIQEVRQSNVDVRLGQVEGSEVRAFVAGADSDDELTWLVDGVEQPQLQGQASVDLEDLGLDDGAALRASVRRNGVVVNSATHQVESTAYSDIEIKDVSLEERALMGDMAEAHNEEAD